MVKQPTDRELLIALLRVLDDPRGAAELAPNERLIAVARRHRLSPLLSMTAGEWLPSELREAFRRDRVGTAARDLVLGALLEECLRALSADDIPAIVLKGLAYQQLLYEGAAGVRPTSDIDLLVPQALRQRAFAVLDALGFEPRASSPGFDDPEYHEVAWRRGNAEVDLHLALVPVVRCDIDYAELWRAARPLRVGESDALTLGAEDSIIFHALHMAVDHFDVPALYLVDLDRLLSAVANVEAVHAKAGAWRARRPLETALALANVFLPRGINRREGARRWSPSKRVVDSFGAIAPLPRTEQLVRKLQHFDAWSDAARYLAVQSRRILHDRFERATRNRSARERLGLITRAPDPRTAGTRDRVH
jgi:hypothetical protein